MKQSDNTQKTLTSLSQQKTTLLGIKSHQRNAYQNECVGGARQHTYPLHITEKIDMPTRTSWEVWLSSAATGWLTEWPVWDKTLQASGDSAAQPTREETTLWYKY